MACSTCNSTAKTASVSPRARDGRGWKASATSLRARPVSVRDSRLGGGVPLTRTGAEEGDAEVLDDVLEGDLDRHTDVHLLRLDVDDVRHHLHAFVEVDVGDNVGQLF